MPADENAAPGDSDSEDSIADDVRNAWGTLESDSDVEDDADPGDADDEMEAEAAGSESPAATSAPAKRKRKAANSDGKKQSRPDKDAKNPVEAKARRVRRIGRKILRELELRADIKMEALNWAILQLKKEDRTCLRELGAMQQEHYLAKRDCVDFIEHNCFNALNSIDLRACEALSTRLMDTIRERLSCNPDGTRKIICKPPDYTGKGNPVTQRSNRDCGIKWENKAVLVPFVFRNSKQCKQAADLVLEGRTLHLAHDFDGSAWDLWEQARDLLGQLERQGNILELPAGVLRELQLIFDGHGWHSRAGAVRFVLRCPQTRLDHNATRNARTPIFALGSDKWAHLVRMMKIGGENSMWVKLHEGLVVTEVKKEELPAHVQADEDYWPAACLKCAARIPDCEIVRDFVISGSPCLW